MENTIRRKAIKILSGIVVFTILSNNPKNVNATNNLEIINTDEVKIHLDHNGKYNYDFSKTSLNLEQKDTYRRFIYTSWETIGTIKSQTPLPSLDDDVKDILKLIELERTEDETNAYHYIIMGRNRYLNLHIGDYVKIKGPVYNDQERHEIIPLIYGKDTNLRIIAIDHETNDYLVELEFGKDKWIRLGWAKRNGITPETIDIPDISLTDNDNVYKNTDDITYQRHVKNKYLKYYTEDEYLKTFGELPSIDIMKKVLM